MKDFLILVLVICCGLTIGWMIGEVVNPILFHLIGAGK